MIRFILRLAALLAAGMTFATVAVAKDVALILTHTEYASHPRAQNDGGDDIAGAALSAAGFQVIKLENLTADRMGRVSEAARSLLSADRIVIFVDGHIVTGQHGSWLLTRDARRADAFTVGRVGIPIEPLLDLAGEKPGQALVLIGPERRQLGLRSTLEENFAPGDIPQGVTVATGLSRDLALVLRDGLLRPGRTIGSVVDAAPNSVSFAGYIPRGLPFLPLPADAAVASGPTPEDQAFWDAMVRLDSRGAYQSYLDRFPDGAFVDEAEERLAALSLSPEALAAAEEDGLGLSRNARREIQRNLSILGYNTRGVDGIFGRGTRTAISSWQRGNGLQPSGYLTGNQVQRIAAAADVRARELEEEARRRREAEERADLAFWRDTGRGESEPGLRSYLERYPDGLYADLARGRLAEIEERNAAAAAEADRELWRQVREINSLQAYQEYLNRRPDGAFAEEAKTRIAQIRASTGASDAQVQAARSEESRVAGNLAMRLLVENRLNGLGLEPGRVDGRFDENSRRAIRRFQRARELTVTGYVTQETLVRMLASR